jgi:hypothetical protein
MEDQPDDYFDNRATSYLRALAAAPTALENEM